MGAPKPLPELDGKLDEARRLLKGARTVTVLTGAGVSAESGLATFRDSGGLWEKHRVEDVATMEGFERDPELVWRFYNARRKAAQTAEPNPAHLALAGLGAGRKVTVLTQNVDGLHQKAGSDDVVELHGNIWRVRCSRCAAVYADRPVELPFPPRCERCPGMLRPDVVWFGELLDPRILALAEEATVSCDLFLVVGTSAQVQPAAAFAFRAYDRGIPVVEVNKEPTPVSNLVAVSLIGLAGAILPALVEDRGN
jgi:NAD-dependent deacetylase